MIAPRSPQIFFKFADNVKDPAPDYDSDDVERILWGISAFAGPQRTKSLAELKVCLEEMLAQFSDEELNHLWSRSAATIHYSDPSLTRAILARAVTVIADELGA
jgi:hypothetical protein